MGLIVQKFGGSSVKDRDRIFNVARIVMNTRNAGNDVVVVVSAQGDTTDDLIAKAAEITSDPSHREMDMLLAAGEEISISLLTMALQELGVSAISLTGWQAGFNTDRAYSKARIKRLDTERVESELARNRVVVVAGFQGLSPSWIGATPSSSSPASRASTSTATSPPWAAAAVIPLPWHWPLPCMQTAARSLPTSRVFSPPTRARSPRPPS